MGLSTLGQPHCCLFRGRNYRLAIMFHPRLCAEEAYAETLYGGSFEILAYRGVGDRD